MRLPPTRLVVLATALVALWAASAAQAAETIYWNNYGGSPDSIGFANTDGSGGGLLNLGSNPIDSPEGMAYDTVTNRLFVTSEEGAKGQILAINLDGSGSAPFTAPGAPIEEPEGITLDPVTRMIYWENTSATPETISWAKLDGSAGGTLNTSGTTLDGACCRMTIDPAGGRVFWVNSSVSPKTIGFANADNSGGGGILSTAGSTVEPGGEGLATDPVGGKIFFTGGNKGEEFGFANLNGTGGGGNVGVGTAVVNGPWGLAFDPASGRLYWGNEANSGIGANVNALGFASLSGSVGNISIGTTPVNGPQDPVIIKSPSGAGVPVLTRGAKAPAALTCSQGTWGVDYPGSFVYQAPRTYAYQWTLNGAAIAEATTTAYTATKPGSYACVVTAANQIGSAAQTSAAATVNAAKLKLSVKKAKAKAGGTAKFKVKAVNQGELPPKGAKVCAKLPKKSKGILKAPKCKSLGNLKAKGKKSVTLKLKVAADAAPGTYKVTFTVKGGKSAKSAVVVKSAGKK